MSYCFFAKLGKGNYCSLIFLNIRLRFNFLLINNITRPTVKSFPNRTIFSPTPFLIEATWLFLNK